MSKKIDTVLEHIAVENQHDMDAMLATLDTDAPVRDEAAGKRYEGRQQIAGRYAELWAAFPDFTVVPLRLIEEGDTVVMLASYSGTHLGQYGDHAPTGKSFSIRLMNIFDFHGDLIASETIFIDSASQLRQLGLLKM